MDWEWDTEAERRGQKIRRGQLEQNKVLLLLPESNKYQPKGPVAYTEKVKNGLRGLQKDRAPFLYFFFHKFLYIKMVYSVFLKLDPFFFFLPCFCVWVINGGNIFWKLETTFTIYLDLKKKKMQPLQIKCNTWPSCSSTMFQLVLQPKFPVKHKYLTL